MASPSEEETLKVILHGLSSLSSISQPPSPTTRLSLLQKSIPLLAQLKNLNRAVYANMEARKNETSEARQQVDVERLKLQNYEYEIEMLRREVRECREFRSIYQDVDMHDLAEFQQLAPEESRSQEILSDPHLLMISRLKFELDERKRLEDEKQTLQTERAGLIRGNKEKKASLEQAEKQIKELLTMAKALEEQFGTQEAAGEEQQEAEQAAAVDIVEGQAEKSREAAA